MKANRRISRKLIFTAAIVALFFACYLHFGLLPGGSKKYAIRKIEECTQKKVRFDKLLLLPFEGLSFRNIEVFDKNDHPIFSAKKLSLNAKILPFFQEKKIIISRVFLDSPVYDFELEPPQVLADTPPIKTKISGQITIPVVSDVTKLNLDTLEEGPDAFLPENVYVEQIEIIHGLVTVRKNSLSPVIEKMHSLQIHMGFDKPPHLTFKGSLTLGDTPYAKLSLEGSWNLDAASYEFHLVTTSDSIPPWLREYQKNHFLILKDGRVLLETRLKNIGESKALFHTKANLENAFITLNQAEYTGRMAVDVEGIFDFDSKSFDHYKGSLDLVKVDVHKLSKKIPSLENISGKILFEPDLLQLDNIQGEFQHVAFHAEGGIRSFKDLLLTARIHGRSDIAQILSLLPEEQIKFLKLFQIRGTCEALTTVNGSLKAPAHLTIEHQLLLHDGSLENPEKKIKIDGLNAEILTDSAAVRIRNTQFLYNDKNYQLDALIPKAPLKAGTAQLKSDTLDFRTDTIFENNTVVFKNATASFPGLTAAFQGKAFDLLNPLVDIQGTADVHCAKLSSTLLPKAEWLKNAGLQGVLHGYFTLKGLWNHPADWDFNMDANAQRIYFKQKLRLDDFQIQLRMKGKILRIPFLHSTLYGGILGADAEFNLLIPGTDFNGRFFLNGVDLGAMAQDLDAAQKDLSGKVALQAALKGVLDSPGTYTGNGSIDIRNGSLWKTNLFKKMGNLVLVKVEGLDFVVFHDLTTAFQVRDKKFWTENLNFLGNTVDLSLKGSVGFDQSLDFVMNVQFSNDIVRGAYDAGGIVPFVVQEAQDFISQYRISGTLKAPKYEQIPLPVGHVIGKKIGSLIQNLSN